MNIFSGSTEIQMLCWSAALGLVQLVIATTLSVVDIGLPYAAGPRDVPAPPVKIITGRFLRAFANFRETFVYFAVAVLLVTLSNKTSATTALGAQLYFWARLVYVPVYAAGVAFARTAIWTVSVVGLVMVLLGMLA
ncbi:MAG TPA: MAPEG family protein [Rhizomicrobium sp.]|nr:MAPEG family protein [Rhizomicrobium sp.]